MGGWVGGCVGWVGGGMVVVIGGSVLFVVNGDVAHISLQQNAWQGPRTMSRRQRSVLALRRLVGSLEGT